MRSCTGRRRYAWRSGRPASDRTAPGTPDGSERSRQLRSEDTDRDVVGDPLDSPADGGRRAPLALSRRTARTGTRHPSGHTGR
jgi:hypothetical protein